MHLPASAARSTNVTGDDAIQLAEIAGLHLDPWQQLVLRESLSERPDGRWSAFECGLVTPRQNGKNAVLEARELVGLFLLDDERLIVHTAHEFPTAMEHFLRVKDLIEGCPDLYARVAPNGIKTSNGKEGIELKDGSRLRFKARTGGSGRGFTGDLVVLDEAFELTTAQMRALMLTLSARPNPQLWYASTAVDQMEQPNGLVLAKVRERAMSGDASRLAYFEWSVDEAEFWDNPEKVASDPEVWAQANPALGIRIEPDHIKTELEAMSGDLRGFGVERLGVGDWPSTTDEDDTDPFVAELKAAWPALEDTTSEIDGPVTFAVDVAPDRSWSSIGVAGRRPDGRWHAELVDRRRGTRWLIDRAVELKSKWDPVAFMVDGRSAAASLIPEFERAGIVTVSGEPSEDEILVKSTASDMAAACGVLHDAATNDGLRHLGQRAVREALNGAGTRPLSGAWAWSRKSGADITALVVVTLALYGHHLFGDKEGAEPMVAWA